MTAMTQLSALEQQTIQDTTTFVEQWIRPHLAERAATPAIDSRGVRQAAASAGLLGLEVPLAHGGRGLSFDCKWRVAEILAAADFGLAMSLINTHNVANHLARSAPPELARRYVPSLLSGERSGCTALTEPGAGSDFGAITTRATRDGQAWQLDGEKAWIINATHADIVLVYAQTDPGAGARGIAAFVIDGRREGFIRSPAAGTTAAAGIDAGGFRLARYRATADEMLHRPGKAFLAALHSINGARTYVAAMCCGMVAECLQVAADFGEHRQTFGQALHHHQGWRWQLAQAAVDLQAARLLVESAAQCIVEGRDSQMAAAQAKIFATTMAGRHIAALMHAMGAEGLRDQHPFLRHLASAQVATLTDGSTEMLLERVAKGLRPTDPV